MKYLPETIMRRYKKSENVSVVLPDKSTVSGTILRISPDNRNVMLRLDDTTEMLTETRFLLRKNKV